MTEAGPRVAYGVLALPTSGELRPDLIMVMGFDELVQPEAPSKSFMSLLLLLCPSAWRL